MTLFVLAYAAGVLTIATPCIFPVLPFVLARGDQPFRRGGFPMLLGLALAFATVTSLASVAGGWAVEANRYGRFVALALMTMFGLTMIRPMLADLMMIPVVSVGSRLTRWTGQRELDDGVSVGSSMLLGMATGLVWAPCAGPILGLILAGAALRGPSANTSLLLLTYGFGAATSLAMGLLVGRRVMHLFRRSAPWGEAVRRIIGTAIVAGTATIWVGLDTTLLARLSSFSTNIFEQRLITVFGRDVELRTGPRDALVASKQWLNTEPLGPADLQGKVVLVNFWTYACINCVRSLPHVRDWAEKYGDRGLMVIGVHTPEFAFEKDLGNVRQAVRSLGVTYPVALDNDYAIWRAFNNRVWPAFYFIDAHGRTRHQVFGEGGYDESEQLIQQLLAEASGATSTRR